MREAVREGPETRILGERGQLELPRLLGRDRDEGARLLRRALEVAPGFADAERAIADHDVGPPVATTTR